MNNIYRDSRRLSKSKITSDRTMKNRFTFYYQYGCRRGYDGLVDISYDKHCRVNDSKNEFSNKSGVHITIGIELKHTEVIQGSSSKRRLAKFNGVKVNFYLHLEECERRYKKTDCELIKELCKILFLPGRKVTKGRE